MQENLDTTLRLRSEKSGAEPEVTVQVPHADVGTRAYLPVRRTPAGHICVKLHCGPETLVKQAPAIVQLTEQGTEDLKSKVVSAQSSADCEPRDATAGSRVEEDPLSLEEKYLPLLKRNA